MTIITPKALSCGDCVSLTWEDGKTEHGWWGAYGPSSIIVFLNGDRGSASKCEVPYSSDITIKLSDV